MKRSAGLLVFRDSTAGEREVLLVHPGGPFFARKDAGVWSIPKGEVMTGEDPLDTARREFTEETGWTPPVDGYRNLGEIRQSTVKRVRAWAARGDYDVSTLHSNEFEMEWPPASGQWRRFPEVDRARWFTLAEARVAIVAGQRPLLDALVP